MLSKIYSRYNPTKVGSLELTIFEADFCQIEYPNNYSVSTMKIYGAFFFLMLTLVSCDLFQSEKATREQLVKEEMRHINWSEPDQYPLFGSCDETTGKASGKACFERTFADHLKTALQQHEFVVYTAINDTVWINVTIDNKGAVRVSNIEKGNDTAAELPQLDSIFRNSITALPKLYPALKRDIPVAAKFRIPVVVQVE